MRINYRYFHNVFRSLGGSGVVVGVNYHYFHNVFSLMGGGEVGVNHHHFHNVFTSLGGGGGLIIITFIMFSHRWVEVEG